MYLMALIRRMGVKLLVRIPLTARSKAWVCDSSLAGIAGSNLAGGMDVSL
jgi:hypothetical protein